jgi:hypothetical protein
VEFHRNSATDGTVNEINSLIPRLGLDINIVNNTAIAGVVKGGVVRTSLGYQTDFDFASGQWVFDIEGELINEAQGLGLFSPRANTEAKANRDAAIASKDPEMNRWEPLWEIPGLPRKIKIAPVISLASIQDIAGKSSLAQLQDMTYASVGITVGLDYELELLKNWGPTAGFATTKVGFEYRVWAVVTGSGSQSFDYLDAHVEMPFLGSADKVNLKLFYRCGDVPVTLEREDLMGLVLTAKF